MGAGGAGPLAEMEDVRERLTEAAESTRLGGVDYLLGCVHSVDTDQLWLAAGTSAGDAAFFPVTEPRSGSRACSFGPAAAVLLGGHTDVQTHVTHLAPVHVSRRL